MSFGVADWAPEYQEVRLEAARVVKVARKFEHEDDAFWGILVAASDEARLYLVIHDLIVPNGATLVRPRDIISETADETTVFVKLVVEAKLAGALPMVPKLTAATFMALCNWLQRARVSGAFFEEETDDSGCEVGRVTDVTSEAVSLDTVSASGEWNDESRIKLDDLTRIDCLGEYERSFDLLHPAG